jgi:hypothetical protein
MRARIRPVIGNGTLPLHSVCWRPASRAKGPQGTGLLRVAALDEKHTSDRTDQPPRRRPGGRAGLAGVRRGPDHAGLLRVWLRLSAGGAPNSHPVSVLPTDGRALGLLIGSEVGGRIRPPTRGEGVPYATCASDPARYSMGTLPDCPTTLARRYCNHRTPCHLYARSLRETLGVVEN